MELQREKQRNQDLNDYRALCGDLCLQVHRFMKAMKALQKAVSGTQDANRNIN